MKIRSIKLFYILVLLSLISFSLNSQEEYGEESEVRLNYIEFTVNPVYPIQTFKNKIDKNLLGFSISYLKQREASRLDYFGIQFSYTHFGSLTQDFIDFEDRTGTNMMSLNFLYRYFPNFYFWRVEPFLEVGIGPQFIYTLTTTTFFNDDTIDYNHEESDFGLNYFIGAGMTIHITDQVFFLSKLSFNGGTSMTYFLPGEYQFGLPIDNFTPETSSISLLNLQLGLSVIF